ncbi:GNAT family N-acetyltransferase [Herpetosiphon llansteffanensis]|uniref:GNAT family N-acetyltransferase n=1 Tax=Herpetosiphon llansteffanensis TaxID=2094568 RepID=UPI000D7C6A23|nr:GNAT family N-acetyltransferase [Herpetosiphon llansteffanensis]
MQIKQIESAAEIASTFAVMQQLRPALVEAEYVARIQRMQQHGYRLAAVVVDGEVQALAGYRFMEMLYAGMLLYVDDLITSASQRSSGHGKALLDWLKAEAKTQGCNELHLDSGVQREQAHKFYFREGLTINAYHFRIALD